MRTVSFFQNAGLATYTGSMFGSSPQELSIIYSVHSAVHLHGNTHHGLTIRLTTRLGRTHKSGQFEHYEKIYRALSQSSVCLGVFSCSAWDSSAKQWSDYARQSNVLAQSASIVAGMISPQNHDVVLDVGSGSGESVSSILKSHKDVSVVMLDGSPQMVHILRDKFRNEYRVQCALCQLPSEDGGGIDIEDEKYSFIVVHQTLGELLKSFGNPEDFANWCRNRMNDNGQLLMTAHNTLVNTMRPDGWSDWKDPFRADFIKELKKSSYKAHIREPQHIIDRNKIVRAFESVGFKLVEERTDDIGLNYEERRRLWHVPAVINSIVDTTKVRANDLNNLVDVVVNSHMREATMPRTVVFWRFLYIDSQGRAKTMHDANEG
ncbi:MAG: methyltransferase domain-containing protein [Planctomycetes bacterium]|nr:methyltransferase domain-containing protein [Planctomycetota bacterium]